MSISRALGRYSTVFSGAVFGLMMLASSWAVAQPPNSETASYVTDTKALVDTRLEQVANSTTLAADVQATLNEIYKKVLAELNSSEVLLRTQADWKQKIDAIPEARQEVELEISTLGDGAEDPPTDVANLTQDQLNDKVRLLSKELQDAQQASIEKSALPKKRDDRRLAMPELTKNLVEARSKLEEDFAQMADREEPANVREARQLLFETQVKNNDLEKENLQSEQAYYDAARELVKLEIELAEKKVGRLTEEYKEWSAQAAKNRKSNAQQHVDERQATAAEVAEPLKSVAAKNVTYAKDYLQLTNDITDATKLTTATRDRLVYWKGDFDRIKELIDAHAGVTESVGNFLREQRAELPDTHQLAKQISERRDLVYEIRSAEFTVRKEQRRLKAMDQSVTEQLNELAESSAEMTPASKRKLTPQVRSLLQDRLETLELLLVNYESYLQVLIDLNVEQEKLRLQARNYSRFVDAQVLWIRSVSPVSWTDFEALPQALAWLVNPELLESFWPSNLRFKKWTVILHIVVGLLVFAGFFIRRIVRARIQELGEQAASRGCREFDITIRSLLYSALLSVSGPLTLAWLGWMVGDLTDPERADATRPLQTSLFVAAIVYWPIALWWNVTRLNGLAHAHFGWSDRFLKRLRQQIGWLMATLVPTGAIYYFFDAHHNLEWDTSIARLALVFGASCLAVWCHSLLSPRNGVIAEYLAYHRTGWLCRLRYFWYPAIVALPILLAVLALMGYQYTAQRLLECLFSSSVFLSLVYLFGAIALRWILINRRRLAMAQAREKLAMLSESGGADDEAPARVGEQVDLVEIDHQTRRLLNAFIWVVAAIGMYLIWVDVLPALSRLNSVELWQNDAVAAQVLDPSSSGENGVAGSVRDDSWVTLGDLLGSILILILMLVAIRNIPGLLEFAVLQHLPFDASIRFAITTVVRYVLIITGMIGALGSIGFGWSKIQWLAAAVSVGLGFGLQEIFANFISGLILLFERPLRMGDIVTVGDVTGTVVDIKTRATTIQDWDRKELVVPNKEFITSQLLNWTLTDQVNRLVITVGVAYGTDIESARELVLKTVASHDDVLEEPAPSVTFDLFGDSALNLTVRCYLADMNNRLSVTNDLHRLIYTALNDAGIEIPFPQRDVHMH